LTLQWSIVEIQINQPTRCNTFTSLLHDVYVRLNMFRALFRPSSGAYNCTRSLWLCLWSVAVGVLLFVVCYHDQQHSNCHAPTVKPEAPSAVVCSWWWGGEAPETCWATHKRHVINLWNCCICWLNYLNHMMMHGLANVKSMEEIFIFKWNIEGSLALQWSIKGILTLNWNISGMLHIKMKYKWRIGHHTPSYEIQKLMAWDWQVMSYPEFYILIPSCCSKAVIWKLKYGKAVQCNFYQSNKQHYKDWYHRIQPVLWAEKEDITWWQLNWIFTLLQIWNKLN
jgi:hypothetical protein